MSFDESALTPFPLAIVEGEEGRMKSIAYGCACVMEEGAKNFGIPLPIPEEVRHSRQVAEVAEIITEGRFSQICSTDGQEGKRIRALAERIVNWKSLDRTLPQSVHRAIAGHIQSANSRAAQNSIGRVPAGSKSHGQAIPSPQSAALAPAAASGA